MIFWFIFIIIIQFLLKICSYFCIVIAFVLKNPDTTIIEQESIDFHIYSLLGKHLTGFDQINGDFSIPWCNLKLYIQNHGPHLEIRG